MEYFQHSVFLLRLLILDKTCCSGTCSKCTLAAPGIISAKNINSNGGESQVSQFPFRNSNFCLKRKKL
jgi:hypothetical protein